MKELPKIYEPQQVMMMQGKCLPGMYFLLWDSIRYVPVHLII